MECSRWVRNCADFSVRLTRALLLLISFLANKHSVILRLLKMMMIANIKIASRELMNILNMLNQVVIVGNGGVGKSSMIQRYCKGIYTKDYKKTIGVDFLERQIE